MLIFEMMAGFPPFYDEDATNTYKKILAGRFSFPSHFSVNSRDLIRKLLQVGIRLKVHDKELQWMCAPLDRLWLNMASVRE